ncbi:MAG TPA: FAD-binding oxidoreductase [Thermoanaerobaculia bacterium]|nr:FAD-binding oxidoreductase [Thermoanaerobaculia bacterium]
MAGRIETAEVVIVGGGVIGASVAYHLAARGCRDVVVLERLAELGGGSTSRATGGFRAQFATEVNVRLSLLARAKLLRFRDEVGADPGYRPCGYLFLARDEAQLATLRSFAPLQRAAGLTEVIEVGPGPEEVRRWNPAVRADGVVGGTFCPSDGFIRPLALLGGYVEAARRLGVRFELDSEVVALEVAQRSGERRVTAVATRRGRIAARHLVNAAGAWAAALAKMASVELPVAPLRRQVATTEPFGGLPEDMPMTIFLEDGFHLRVRDGRVLLLWPADLPANASNPYDAAFVPSWLDGLLPRARARVPCLAAAAVDRAGCWAGLYEMSPDKHAIVGPAPGCPNFLLVNGSSGHGVMHSPALGQLAAEMILDGGAQAIDLAALRPSRFAEGQPNPASDVL